ncbi:MAG TPA: FYDLN acid domain-containing protein, partial [Myxococcota bacterium]|nr:FYDLN acid domain-containing protein [Myxococcota bacterium]
SAPAARRAAGAAWGGGRAAGAVVGAERGRGGLGTKYSCFKCGSKFYDLNRPKALCPKCGADQRDAPKQTGKQRPAPPPPKIEPDLERDRDRERDGEVRRVGPLLDEDDEEIVIEDEPEDLELALEVVEDEEFVEADEEEPEEES